MSGGVLLYVDAKSIERNEAYGLFQQPARDSLSVELYYLLEQFFSGFFAAAHAVGDADAVVGTAGEREIGILVERRFDPSNPRLMADMILGHRVGVALDANQQRFGLDTDQAGELSADVSFHGRVIVIKKFRLQAAANEGAQ